MSLQFNTEPGGIVWQARKLMAESPDVKPLDKNAVSFAYYAAEMSRARALREGLNDEQTLKYRVNLTAGSVDYPIGRLLESEEELPSGKHLTTQLTLLNESLGNMPDYVHAEAGVRKIGRVAIFLHTTALHHHGTYSNEEYEYGLVSGIDILTDGSVHMPTCMIVTCTSCRYIDIDDETRVIDHFEFKNPYPDYEYPVPSSRFSLNARKFPIQRFTNHQVAALQSFLTERFSPSADL